ncbi:MAG: GIY-YIG nuclease family protein [Selenomonadaceae bacterium]|nr:GIY-YIG nuclease family protein [Selenomonadaceae bacterium]
MIIYKIKNKINGKIYVGQTQRELEERMKEHQRNSRPCYIDRAIKKYGIENFSVEVIEECDILDELNEREIFWIRELNCKYSNGYNLSDGGKGSTGYIITPELSLKLSELRKGRRNTPEQRAKISATLKGRIFSEETKRKISAAKIGHIVSEETREKLRKANLGKKATEATKAKMSVSSSTKRPVQCIEMGKIFESITAAAKFFEITNNTITTACKNSNRTASGFHWKFCAGK